MTRHPVSIKAELSDAVASGIRRRGPDAVGLLLVGIARSIVVVSTLAALMGLAAAFGYEPSVAHLLGIASA